MSGVPFSSSNLTCRHGACCLATLSRSPQLAKLRAKRQVVRGDIGEVGNPVPASLRSLIEGDVLHVEAREASLILFEVRVQDSLLPGKCCEKRLLLREASHRHQPYSSVPRDDGETTPIVLVALCPTLVGGIDRVPHIIE